MTFAELETQKRRLYAWMKEVRGIIDSATDPDERRQQQERLRILREMYRDALRRAMAALTDNQRECIMALYGRGMPVEAIAAERGVQPALHRVQDRADGPGAAGAVHPGRTPGRRLCGAGGV